jgi:hypothetical protein
VNRGLPGSESKTARVVPHDARVRLRSALALGLVLGTAFGVWNVVAASLAPLQEDTPSSLLLFYGPMFATWGVAGLAATRRSDRLADGASAGALVACATFVVLTIIVIGRVNLSLDVTSQRPDWQNLVARFDSSGFASLRAYANYVYLTGAPFKILVASTLGAAFGFIGGCIGRMGRRGTLLSGNPAA